jgi:hypothetical protein
VLGLLAQGARRRLGVIDARLVGLRVKENSLASPLPDDLQQLERLAAEHAASLDELRRWVADYRRLERRGVDLRAELEQTRRELTPERLRLLEEFEAARGAPRPAAAARPRAAEPPAERDGIAVDRAASQGVPPEQLLALAAAGARRSHAEVRELLGPVLPLYLRALTHGRCSQLLWLEEDDWYVERSDGGRRLPLRTLEPAERTRVSLALRLALLEVLAPSLRVPLLVGPAAELGGEEDALPLARALARLGSVLQVIHFCVEAGPFAGQARAVHRLSA